MGEFHKNTITIFLIGCLILVGIAIVQKAHVNGKLEDRAAVLSAKANVLGALNEIDQTRRQNLAKVVDVINRFNQDMSTGQKYQIASEICEASIKYDNLDVDLICAIITHESALTWDPEVVSPVGAMGLMQVMPATGKFLANIEGLEWTTAEDVLFDPVINIRLGSHYLSSLIELYDVDGGLAAYNGGGKRAEMWLAQNRAHGILFEETQNYVPAVLSLYEEFRN